MKPLLTVLQGQALPHPPIWLMRQAGRFLPEYRAVREQAGSFLSLVYDPVKACEVTVQPLRRFGMDAAILFSDILVVPQAMGVSLQFTAGEGPQLDPVQNQSDLSRLDHFDPTRVWSPVLETVDRVRTRLSVDGFDQCTLIGFAGAPWTIACYMVAGNGHDHDFAKVKERAFSDTVFFDDLIQRITQATIQYVLAQIQAGAEAIQIFDSWAGAASGTLFSRYVIEPTKQIVQAIHSIYPGFPVIGFPRLAGVRVFDYADQTGIQALGLDSISSLHAVRAGVNPRLVLQGNLDPMALVSGGAALDQNIAQILIETKGTPHIFNLGHGVLPSTPLDHVARLIHQVRAGL